MSVDKCLSDFELEEIRKEYGNKIVLFSQMKQEIEDWYKEFGLEYPLSSINNYRDSWFHYRKIWVERSYYENICQTSTFDEHLQRAEKDAIVKFFQTISQELEFWYQIKTKKIPAEMMEDIRYNTYIIYNNSEPQQQNNNMWLDQLWLHYSKIERMASFAMIYAAQEYVVNSNDACRQIQRLLHKVKNITLKIRSGASDIDRIEQPGEYVNSYSNCYQEVYDFFHREENAGLFYLLGITYTVKANWDSYEVEKGNEEIAMLLS